MPIQEGYDCLTLDGVDDYVRISAVTVSSPINITLECWVYLDSASKNGAFIKIGDATTGYGIGVGNTSFDAGSPGNYLIGLYEVVRWIKPGATLGIGWSHVAMVIDSSGNPYFYINGIPAGNVSGPGPLAPSAITYIGGYLAASNSRYFNGKIDEVRIWNVARTQAEIQVNMNKQLSGNEAGLAGYWKLDEGGGLTAYDSTANANHGTLTNGPIWDYSYNTFRLMSDATMKVKTISDAPDCLSFDGVDDYIDINSSFGILANYTISFWAKRNAEDKMPIGSRVNSAFYWYGDNSWRWTHGGVGSEYYYPKSVNIPLGTWGHFTVTYDGSLVNIYRNGVLEGSISSTGTADFSNGFYIGNWSAGAGYNFIGSITDVRIWNVALTQAQIQANMNTQLIGNETGLVGYWKLNEGGGLTAHDSTANANNGTLINGPIWDYSYSNYRLTKDGILKVRDIIEGPDCIVFDGSNDYVDCGTRSSLKLVGDMTLEAWIYLNHDLYPVGTTNWEVINSEIYQVNGFLVRIDGASGQIFFRTNKAGIESYISGNTTLLTRTWNHVAISKLGNTTSIYLNGIFDGSGLINDAVIATSSLKIGGDGQFFDGKINEIRMWNVAHTQAQIQANMKKQLAGNEAGLVGYWNFNEGSGITAYDSTSNGNNGTLTNGPLWGYSYPGIFSLGEDGILKIR